jgi:glycosyltransferase involved in cell wall biosynthesis
LPEVVGDAGIMMSPIDEDEICEALVKLIKDKSLRETMARKSLQQAAKFSWEKCVQQTIEGYKQAGNTKK